MTIHHAELWPNIYLVGEGKIRRPSLFIGLLYFKKEDYWRKIVSIDKNNIPTIRIFNKDGNRVGIQDYRAFGSDKIYEFLYGQDTKVLFPGEKGCLDIPELLRCSIKAGEVICQFLDRWRVWQTNSNWPDSEGITHMLVSQSVQSESCEPINNNGRTSCYWCNGPLRDVIGCFSVLGQVCDLCGK